MADTVTNVELPANTWVDLYATSGIAVGTPLVVENVGNYDVRLAVQAAQPSINHDAFNVLQRENGIRLANNSGDSGAWALSKDVAGRVNVSNNSGFLPDLRVTVKNTSEFPSGGVVSLAVQVDEVGNTLYKGEANPGSSTASGVWRVSKIVDTSGDISITWADGSSSFNQVWDDRLSLTYS